jgi:hypothetical protein
MEKLVMDNTKVSEADLYSLATRRAQILRDWLVTQGKIASTHIFVLESLVAKAGDDKGKSPALPAARADFSLK